MRDGTRLYADVYRPVGGSRYPVLLQRTPYNKELPGIVSLAGDPVAFAGAGYAVVIQDSRGSWASEGTFAPFRGESEDGYDSVEWCAAQPWSTGRVGMFGVSYNGLVQWLTAAARPPHLVTLLPTVAGASAHDGWTYRGGAFELNFNLSLSLLYFATQEAMRGSVASDRDAVLAAVTHDLDRLPDLFTERPLVDQPLLEKVAPYYLEWLRHPSNRDYWADWSIDTRYSQIDLPVFHVGGWYDTFVDGTIKNFIAMCDETHSPEVRANQRLVVGPWSHGQPWLSGMVGDVDFGFGASAAAIGLQSMQLRWCDRWLKGVADRDDDARPVLIFVMGVNEWREESEWPLARTKWRELFFHSDGEAHRLEREGGLSEERPADEPCDTFVYDPEDPVPTRGGPLCCSPLYSRGGPFDQSCVEKRLDVLTYSSPFLDDDLEVTGEVIVRLWASSSAVDTDWTAKLVDVGPKLARNVTEGIIRARYRSGPFREEMLVPGEVYEYEIRLPPTSNVFKRGHQLRIEISSSNFPRFDPNPNTGGEIAVETRSEIAQQRIYHDRAHPSCLLLPTIPAR